MSAVTAPVPRPSGAERAWRRLVEWLPAIVVFLIGLATWQWLLPDVFNVDKSLLPRFSAVMSSFWDERGYLWHGGWITLKVALAGFTIGCGLAFFFALVLARWRPLGNALLPYMVAANAIPIIAFAPITNAWFGILNSWSKIAITAVLCFFPVLVNTLRGLTSVRPESIELMRSYAATEREIFRRVRVPTSLPFVFTSLKVASVLAMIGAVVGDYFGGNTEALGVQMVSAVSIGQYETAWAAILVACIMGIAFYASIALIERFVLSWHPSTRGTRE